MNKPAVAVACLVALAPITLYTGSVSERNATAEACRALADLRIEDTNLLSAAVVPAGDGLPEYCRVLGYVRPAINFEIRLPTSNWNGKFYMAGCWGYCGRLATEDTGPDYILGINAGLKRGYATSTMDTGHWGEDVFDQRWAYDNRQAEIDWAYRGVHETARVTKAMIKAFYGQGPEHSYLGGCSGGGRQANVEAMRYPDDFDGLIAGASHPKITGTALLDVWLARANTGPDGKNLIGPAEARLVEKAVYAACDTLDGLKDGLIDDPRACHFDPATLACAGTRSTNCLSEKQVDALKKMYDGPRDSKGRQLYAGLPLGSEPSWGAWVVGETADARDDFPQRAGIPFMRYLAFLEDPGEEYSLSDFDFDRDPERMEPMAQIYNFDNHDLDAFRESGGKLLMWHGWADAGPPPEATVRYYESVEDRIGNRDSTQAFFRLFMIPGMDPCGFGDGPGIDQHGFDPLTTLEQWVEQGEAPASLFTTKTDSTGSVLWTRPVCPYPQRARYKGTGDVLDAASFECINS